MKRTKLFVLLLLINLVTTPLFSQGFIPPAESNAAIYFIRVSSYGGISSFEYFHNEDFIGIFRGKNYMRFEYPAGEHLFWAASEDKEFLKCDLKAGETYLVLVNIEMGVMKARIGLEPITEEHKVFKRAKALVDSKKPIETPKEKIESTKKKLAKKGFVERIMEKYETEWKDGKNTKIISQDMFVPIEFLQ